MQLSQHRTTNAGHDCYGKVPSVLNETGSS